MTHKELGNLLDKVASNHIENLAQEYLEKIALDPEVIQSALGVAVPALAGGLGYHMGKKQRQRGEKYQFGGPQMAGFVSTRWNPVSNWTIYGSRWYQRQEEVQEIIERNLMYIITRGLQTGKSLTPAQRGSSLFAEEPVVLGKVFRRGHPPLQVSDELYELNKMNLERLAKAGSINITQIQTKAETEAQEPDMVEAAEPTSEETSNEETSIQSDE